MEKGVEVAGDGGGNVDGIVRCFAPDEGEVDVDGVAVEAEASGVGGDVEEVEDAVPFEFEFDGSVEEDEVLAVEGFGGAEVVEGVVFEAVAGEAVFHGLHGDATTAGVLGLGRGGHGGIGSGDTSVFFDGEFGEGAIDFFRLPLAAPYLKESGQDRDQLHGNQTRDEPENHHQCSRHNLGEAARSAYHMGGTQYLDTPFSELE